MALSPTQSEWKLRPLLVLGRVSNLPTLWSNCVAGWVLGGGGAPGRFVLLCLGATFLYVAGLYLNDAFDVGFDQQRRRERPIPSGQISLAMVWRLGWVWLALGVASFAFLGRTCLVLACVLAATIVFYNAIHKRTTLSVVLMGLCRFFVYLLAAGAARGVHGAAIWAGLALGLYVGGLSYLARKESIRGPVRWGPVLTLAAPIVLALLANGPDYRERAFYLSLLLVLWILPALRFVFRKEPRQIGFAVSKLLAGIVLVDLLATAGEPWGVVPAFGALFILALMLQRYVPAT